MFDVIEHHANGRRLSSWMSLFALLLALLLVPPIAHGAVRTPTRGPLSRRPTIRPHKGPPSKVLVIRDIVRGTGQRAKSGDLLTTNYLGVLYGDGKVFDSSWSRGEPFSFAFGSGDVIPGWERGLVGMRVGGRRELIIPPALAYGKRGSPPTVPPNSTLIFIVDLLVA